MPRFDRFLEVAKKWQKFISKLGIWAFARCPSTRRERLAACARRHDSTHGARRRGPDRRRLDRAALRAAQRRPGRRPLPDLAAAVGKLRRACRALRAFDWAPVWAALVEARFPFAGQRDVEAYRRTDAGYPLLFRPNATSVSYADLDDGPAFLAGGAAGTRWARGDVLTRSRRRFRVAFGAVLGAGRAYVGLAVARVFDDGAATLSSDDAILISSHGYISSATGGGAEGIPNRWGPGPDGWVDVRVDLDTHYISIATRLDRNGYIGLSEHSLRRRLRKGEALVPVVGVVAGSDAQLLPLVDTSAPPPWVPDVTGPFQDPHELPHVAFTL